MKVFSAKPKLAIRIENCKLNRAFICVSAMGFEFMQGVAP